ncbi:salicylate synthase [Candidatus Foliamicus sp.]
MTQKWAYREMVIPFEGDPLSLATRMAQSAAHSDYMLYEHQGEWSLGLSAQGRVTLYPDRTLVTWEGRELAARPNEDLNEAIQWGLDQLPVERWRAYGTAAFELARLTYGLPVPSGTPLLTLFVPKEEIRIDETTIRIRAFEPDRLAALGAMVEQAVHEDDDFEAPTALDLEDEIATHDAETYKRAVAEALEEIHAQQYRKVILSRQISLNHSLDMAASYGAGRRANTPARSYLLRLDGLEAAGFSPETVIEVNGEREVFTTPLAGTRSTGGSITDELRLRGELLSDSKEIAEHAISVYVGFDELTMVCDPANVSVVNFMLVSRRGAVQHLASRLKGKLLDSCNPWYAFNALFPAVTASGVPKRESIDAIGRLEPNPRGLYAGCAVIYDHTGVLDAALVLRSFYQRDGTTWLQAGAGIMNMSSPERELEETREKLSSFARHLVAAAAR